MSQPLISVIVPVYKVEEYLPKCIDSILAQTHTNFELLLIDDGSPDNSGKICDEYGAKDSRIKVFHKENGGVSSARNLGLDNATGDWVSFIDPDDWISSDFLEIPGKFKDADVIQKSSYTICEKSGDKCGKVIKKDFELNSFESIAHFFVNKRTSALWDKIIARRVIDKKFDKNISIGEDSLFFMSILMNVNNYAFYKIGSYNYLIRKGSAVQEFQNKYSERIACCFENIENIKKVSNNPQMIYIQNSVIYSYYVSRIYYLMQISKVEQWGILKTLLQDLNWKDLKYLSLKNKVKLLRIIILVYIFK